MNVLRMFDAPAIVACRIIGVIENALVDIECLAIATISNSVDVYLKSVVKGNLSTRFESVYRIGLQSGRTGHVLIRLE